MFVVPQVFVVPLSEFPALAGNYEPSMRGRLAAKFRLKLGTTNFNARSPYGEFPAKTRYYELHVRSP